MLYNGDIFVEMGLITPEQLQNALEKQKEVGLHEPIDNILVQMGLVTERDRVRALGALWGIAFWDLSENPPQLEAVKRLSSDTARRHKAIPVRQEENRLIVAMANPLDIFAIDEIRILTGNEIEVVIAPEEDILNAQRQFYRLDASLNQAVQEVMKEVETAGIALLAKEEELSTEELREMGEEAPIVRLTNMIITQAIADGASDIHIEPAKECVKVRYRIDGVMMDSMVLPKRLQAPLISRFKIMSAMDIAEKRIPQDNRISALIDGKEYDFRVSTLPCLHGEKVVMRVLDKSSIRIGLHRLGFLPDTLERLEQVISRAYGIILVTGPTGSGKSTTLYSILSKLNTGLVNIITAEDPAEYELPGINQVQVNPKAGLTFAIALRAMLRQDPDVIMVGEMRDRETATIAIEAALTGHLVLSTLHTNDAPSAPPRLIEMGVEPFMIASSLIGVLAQRLARTICNRCKESYVVPPEVLERHGFTPPAGVQEITLYKGRGCEQCKNTGYKGRTGLHELMTLNDEIRDLILKHAASHTIQQAAIARGMRTLKEDALCKVLLGITTLEEVVRVIYSG